MMYEFGVNGIGFHCPACGEGEVAEMRSLTGTTLLRCICGTTFYSVWNGQHPLYGMDGSFGWEHNGHCRMADGSLKCYTCRQQVDELDRRCPHCNAWFNPEEIMELTNDRRGKDYG